MSAQQGDRAKNYQVAFTEPFLFDRPITAGVDLFIREIRYINQFTQASTGGNIVYGFQVSPFSRMFVNYSLRERQGQGPEPAVQGPRVLAGNPFLADSLLIGAGQHRTISKIGPSYVYNTVDSPITPTTGKRLTASLDVAGRRRQHELREPARRGHLVPRAEPADVARLPRSGGVHHPIREHRWPCRSTRSSTWAASTACAASTSNGRSARPGDRPRARRQQEPAVQC